MASVPFTASRPSMSGSPNPSPPGRPPARPPVSIHARL
jgi:hypothetical protein